MPGAQRGFRIFLSSTFEDFRTEREALHRSVFPALRSLCAESDVPFHVVDLQWGITDAGSRAHRSVDICRTEVERCRAVGSPPTFLFLLGDRYGWIPLPSQIPDQEFRSLLEHLPGGATDRERSTSLLHDWYQLDENAVPVQRILRSSDNPIEWRDCESELRDILLSACRRAKLSRRRRIEYEGSATEREIETGVFDLPGGKQNSLGFVRSIVGLPSDQRAWRFLDLDQQARRDKIAAHRLAALKTRLGKVLHGRIDEFTAQWTGEGISEDHVGEFCALVLDRLLGEVRKHLSTPVPNPQVAHEEFRQRQLTTFSGRRSVVRRLKSHLVARRKSPLIVYGDPGSGKTSLLAKAVGVATELQPKPFVLHRFIGAARDSWPGERLLHSLFDQLRVAGRLKPPAKRDNPRDAEKSPDKKEKAETRPSISRLFTESFLKDLVTDGRHIVVIIDGLDLLLPGDSTRRMSWLPAPHEFPKNLHIILSTAAGECLDTLKKSYPKAKTIKVGSMTRQEQTRLLEQWLADDDRTITPKQRKALPQGTPFYLKLAYEEARLWRHDLEAPQLPPDVPSLARSLFHRLSEDRNHGPCLVERSLAYLAASREGLSEAEMVDILSHDNEVMADFRRLSPKSPDVERLPLITWTRFLQNLSSSVQISEDGLLRILNAVVSKVVEQDYLQGDRRRLRHRHLARQMERRDSPFSRARTITELPLQLSGGHLPRSLARLLVSAAFIRDKVEASGSQPLIEDYQMALSSDLQGVSADTRQALSDLQDAIRLSASVLDRSPHEVPSQLHGRLIGHSSRAVRSALSELGRTRATWLRPQTPSLAPPGGAAKRTLGAPDIVWSAVLSHDGCYAASVALDNPIQVFAAETSERVATLPAGTVAALDRVRNQLVTGHADGSLKAWRFQNGALVFSRVGHRSRINALSVSADGTTAVSGAGSILKVWDLVNRRVVASLRAGAAYVLSLAVTADGRRAISTATSPRQDRLVILLWNLRTKKATPLHGTQDFYHTDVAGSVAIRSDGKQAVTGAASGDCTLIVWDLDHRRPIRQLLGHTGPVRSIAYFPDDRRVISASGDGTLRIWNVENGRNLATFEGHVGGVNTVSLDDSGHTALSGAEDATLKLWSLKTRKRVRGADRHAHNVNSVAIARDTIVSASHEGTVTLWNLKRASKLRSSSKFGHALLRTRASPNEMVFATAAMNEPIGIWELPTMRRKWEFQTNCDWINALTFTPDGRFLLSAGSDDIVHVWDLRTGKEARRIGGRAEVTAIAITSDGERIITGSEGGSITIFDASTCETLEQFRRRSGRITDLCVTADDRSLIVGFGKRPPEIWSLTSPHRRPLTDEADHGAEDFCIFPDKLHVVYTVGTLKIRDLRTGELVATFSGDSFISCCALSPDGRRIVAGDGNGAVHFLHVSNLPS